MTGFAPRIVGAKEECQCGTEGAVCGAVEETVFVVGERGLKPATTCLPARYLKLVVAGFSPRSARAGFLIRRSELTGRQGFEPR